MEYSSTKTWWNCRPHYPVQVGSKGVEQVLEGTSDEVGGSFWHLNSHSRLFQGRDKIHLVLQLYQCPLHYRSICNWHKSKILGLCPKKVNYNFPHQKYIGNLTFWCIEKHRHCHWRTPEKQNMRLDLMIIKDPNC